MTEKYTGPKDDPRATFVPGMGARKVLKVREEYAFPITEDELLTMKDMGDKGFSISWLTSLILGVILALIPALIVHLFSVEWKDDSGQFNHKALITASIYGVFIVGGFIGVVYGALRYRAIPDGPYSRLVLKISKAFDSAREEENE